MSRFRIISYFSSKIFYPIRVQIVNRSLSTSVCCKQNTTIIDREDDPSIIVPVYKPKEGESFKIKKARVLYQSRKRGMLENGILLSTFAAEYLDKMNEHQLDLYDKLINLPSNDWDIYNWAIGAKPTPDDYNNEIMELLKKHTQNTDRTLRLRQPDLYE